MLSIVRFQKCLSNTDISVNTWLCFTKVAIPEVSGQCDWSWMHWTWRSMERLHDLSEQKQYQARRGFVLHFSREVLKFPQAHDSLPYFCPCWAKLFSLYISVFTAGQKYQKILSICVNSCPVDNNMFVELGMNFLYCVLYLSSAVI